ncbi:MAG: ABC transporter ATP-binding protein/permease [Syntrophomonadaceae bacterium]|nr:ABC transporter ATP-binding protein/permease [Syntrophomonadaceae bacterium]
MKKGKGFVVSSIKCIGIIFDDEPKMLVLHCSFTIAHGLSWALQVVFTQIFFDAAQNLVQKKVDLNYCILAMVMMILSYAFCQVMNGVDNCHARILDLAASKHVNLKIFDRIDKLNCVEFENTERLDFINKAMNGGGSVVWVCLTLLDTIFFYTTYFVSISFYLFTLKPTLSIAMLAIFLPCLLSNVIQIKTFKKLEDASAPIRRKCDYYEGYASDLRETRLLGATVYFKNLYLSYQKKLNSLVFRTQMKKSAVNLSVDALTVIGYGVILFMIFISVLRREISIGAFTAVLASIGRLFSFMSEVISERIRWASENTVTLNNYLSFISENTETEKKGAFPQEADIILENVTFTYPGSETSALDKINLNIKYGHTIAIVGENGSGKSTLCKLILGIYCPTDGNILIGGKPQRIINQDNISAIFQDYCKYKMTLKENICISKPNTDVCDTVAVKICEDAGINIDNKNLENGVNTMLGRDFDGAELSGGQWQRIAVARGLIRASELIVLDEPTSAIDPLEETHLYNEFMKICRNKTAVIVTHRLGAIKIADRIIVLKNGKIVEDGTHKQLIDYCGEYKKMFDAQSMWYV